MRLGVFERTFRFQIDRYEADGVDWLIDKRRERVLHRRALVDGVVNLADLHRHNRAVWSVQHLDSWSRCEDRDARNGRWVKSQLQQASVVNW